MGPLKGLKISRKWKEMNSRIEIDSAAARQMIRALDGKNYKGRRIRMNEANSR